MKLLNLQSVLKYVSKYSYCFFVIQILLVLPSNAQVSKTFQEEIDVENGVDIFSNVPSTIGVHVNGTMITNNTMNRYSINGKNDDVRLNILKDLKIDTWDKNKIRQETIITVNTDSEKEAEKLLDALKMDLAKQLKNKVQIDCNMNIESFSLKNGWFRSDDCKIVLEDGQSYPISYLSIETKLTIPKSSNLSLSSNKNCTILLGDLEGNLNLDLKYAEVYGSVVNNLNAQLRWCYNVYFDEVDKGSISATHSYVNIKKANGIKIGESSISEAPSTFDEWNTSLSNKDGYKIDYKGGATKKDFENHFHSTQSKYTFGVVNTVSIFKSMGDTFNASEIDKLDIKKANYSSFRVRKLNTSADVQAKSSDVIISKINRLFENVSVENALCDVDLMVESDANYTLELDVSEYLEKYLSNDLEAVEQNGTDKEVYQVGDTGSGGNIFIKCEKCKFHFN